MPALYAVSCSIFSLKLKALQLLPTDTAAVSGTGLTGVAPQDGTIMCLKHCRHAPSQVLEGRPCSSSLWPEVLQAYRRTPAAA